MSTKYKALNLNCVYFITTTIVHWVDLFTRLKQRNLIIKSLKYCQENKGLVIFAYCLMPSHLHLICKSRNKDEVFKIIRDFKKYTSKEIIRIIKKSPESRKDWILKIFSKEPTECKKDHKYKVWQNGYHAILLHSKKFIDQKLKYIHNNPVVDEIVQLPHEYLYSSARNYLGLGSKLEVEVLAQFDQLL